MSYSFTVKAPNKADAKVAVAKAFDGVVASQPIHARDREAAIAAAGAVIDLLADDPASDISVSVNGYVSWRDVLKADASNELSGASVSAGASLVAAAEPLLGKAHSAD